MLGSTESERVRLISREIIFAEQNSNLYDHDTSTLQTDRRTDRQTERSDGQLALAIPRSARLRAVKIYEKETKKKSK